MSGLFLINSSLLVSSTLDDSEGDPGNKTVAARGASKRGGDPLDLVFSEVVSALGDSYLLFGCTAECLSSEMVHHRNR